MCVVVEEVASRCDVTEDLALFLCMDVPIVVVVVIVCQSIEVASVIDGRGSRALAVGLSNLPSRH